MKQQSITSLPQSPDAERHSRMVKYSVAMGIRVLCLISILFIHGWWIVIPAMGAVFLPYFAVVLANVGSGERGPAVRRPGNIVPVNPAYAADGDFATDGDSGATPTDAGATIPDSSTAGRSPNE